MRFLILLPFLAGCLHLPEPGQIAPGKCANAGQDCQIEGQQATSIIQMVVEDQCSGPPIYYDFTDVNSGEQWPGGTSAYTINVGETATTTIQCVTGMMICAGGRNAKGDIFTMDLNGLNTTSYAISCEDPNGCCAICNEGVTFINAFYC